MDYDGAEMNLVRCGLAYYRFDVRIVASTRQSMQKHNHWVLISVSYYMILGKYCGSLSIRGGKTSMAILPLSGVSLIINITLKSSPESLQMSVEQPRRWIKAL